MKKEASGLAPIVSFVIGSSVRAQAATIVLENANIARHGAGAEAVTAEP
jgi:hypothetical protein